MYSRCTMQQKYEDYYKTIRKKITDYLERKKFAHSDMLLLAPDFFHLLVKMSMDNRVPKGKKVKFAAGVAYFISPLDFIPEAILGPIGYMDDLAVAAYILNDYINEGDLDIIYEHWAGESDILASIQNIIRVADSYLGGGLWERIKQKYNQGA
ncbi:MAG: DUF1232 domain-containing protein [Caldithrix sp.]|nr:DUF1232 domain-containing protein [Caldithrix sp.]